MTPQERRLECRRETEPFNPGDGTDCLPPEASARPRPEATARSPKDEMDAIGWRTTLVGGEEPPAGAPSVGAPLTGPGLLGKAELARPPGAARGSAVAREGVLRRDERAIQPRSDAPARAGGEGGSARPSLPSYDGKSPAAIRAEMARTREEMTRTIHALKARITSPRLREQFMDRARDATLGRTKAMAERYGSDAMRSTLDFLKEHPIPVALAAIGLGWLASGWGRGSTRGLAGAGRGALASMRSWRGGQGERVMPDATEELGGVFKYYPRDRDASAHGDDEGPGLGDASRAPYAMGGPRPSRAEMTGGMPSDGSGPGREGWTGHPAGGGRETSAGAQEQARGMASRSYDQARETASSVYGQARETVSGAYDQARRAVSGYMEQGRRTMGDAQGRVQGGRSWQGRSGSSLDRTIQDNALLFGLGALTAGALVGMFVRRSRYEDELMGDARDDMLHQIRQRGRDAMQSMLQAASEAGHRVMDEWRGGERAGEQAAMSGRAGQGAQRYEGGQRHEGGQDESGRQGYEGGRRHGRDWEEERGYPGQMSQRDQDERYGQRGQYAQGRRDRMEQSRAEPDPRMGRVQGEPDEQRYGQPDQGGRRESGWSDRGHRMQGEQGPRMGRAYGGPGDHRGDEDSSRRR